LAHLCYRVKINSNSKIVYCLILYSHSYSYSVTYINQNEMIKLSHATMLQCYNIKNDHI